MTKEAILAICKEMDLYRTPYLNEVLYLHNRGWERIENLEEYTATRVLWLQGNGLTTIENIDCLGPTLRTLHLNQNIIDSVEGLGDLPNLDLLNLSENRLVTLKGMEMANMPQLHSLDVSYNQIATADDVISGLVGVPELEILNLSNNRLDLEPTEEGALQPLIEGLSRLCPKLRVLNLMGNPITRKMLNYRRTIIAALPELRYLDDHPVFDEERRAVNAWVRGGKEAEMEERRKIREEQESARMQSLEYMRGLVLQGQMKQLNELLSSNQLEKAADLRNRMVMMGYLPREEADLVPGYPCPEPSEDEVEEQEIGVPGSEPELESGTEPENEQIPAEPESDRPHALIEELD